MACVRRVTHRRAQSTSAAALSLQEGSNGLLERERQIGLRHIHKARSSQQRVWSATRSD